MSKLVLALSDGQSGSVLDAGQQEGFLPAQLPLSVAQREVGTVQLLQGSS